MKEAVACSCCTYVRYTCLQHAFQGLLNSSVISVASISSFNDKEVNADLFDSIFTVLIGYIPTSLVPSYLMWNIEYWWLIHTERKKVSTNNFKTKISNVEPFFCSRIKMKRPKQARDQPAWMAPPSPPQCWKVTIGHVTTSVILTKITERYMTQHHIDIWFQSTANTMSIVRKLSEAFRYSIHKNKGQTL